MPQLDRILALVGPTDLLDIVLTSVFIYYVLLLIRGTRAVQILLGILVLLGLLGIANVLHLYLLGSILQLLVVGAAVTLPIVFQPELRRALEQLGRGDLFRLETEETEEGHVQDRVTEEIVRTATALSRNRIGALIVLERQSGLKEFAESGTLLDAHLSAELLLAIFAPRSPLHDGAVIIRDGRIEAAGCFLPLADQPLGERRLGTRHRAALGLSEQTDAVVVVVSEESGAVSIARGGKLSRPFEDDVRLRRALLASVRPPRQRRAFSVRASRGIDLVAHVRERLFAPRMRSSRHADHPS
jgi:diadenylate cyclase